MAGNERLDTTGASGSGGGAREEQVARLLAECSNRLNAGERVDVEKVIAEHADLAPELGAALRSLGRFQTVLKADLPSTTLGEYQILRELGRGGMGIVYEALQVSLNRRVALKVLPRDLLPSQRAVERFKHEAKVASRVSHPGICTVYDAGVEEGVPYIAMQYIEGETLAARIAAARDRGSVSPGTVTEDVVRRLEDEARGGEPMPESEGTAATTSVTKEEIAGMVGLIERAARALHVAHEAGFVHRDIKPGNILVTRGGDPVVLDFGLAQEEEGGGKRLTVSGELLGTPAYMSPEQIAAMRIKVDRRTDVYSLGVTLYEGLTLKLPFEAPTREGMFRKILGSDPPDARRLNRHISKDLRVVLETALEKDVDRRYQTALDFAEDLRRVREYEPIRARPAGPVLRFRRWGQRNPVLATATLGLFVILAVGLTISLVLLDRVNTQREIAQVERDAKEAALEREKGRRLTTSALYLLPTNPELALLLGIEAAKRSPDPEANSALLEILSGRSEHKVLAGHRGQVYSIEFSPDGRKVLTSSEDGTARVWDASTCEQLLLLGGNGVDLTSAAFSPDGRLIGTASNDGTARIWDASTGQETMRLEGRAVPLKTITFSSDGLRVLTAGEGKEARIWDARTGKELFTLNHGAVEETWAAFSPDGALVVTSSDYSKSVLIWNAVTGKEVFSLDHDFEIGEFSFSPNGKRLITSTYGSFAYVWDLSTGNNVLKLPEHNGLIDVVAYNHRADRILTSSSNDGMARIWEADTGKELLRLQGHERRIYTGVFSTDDERVVTASEDRTARIWDAKTGDCLKIFRGHENWLCNAIFSPDGLLVATC